MEQFCIFLGPLLNTNQPVREQESRKRWQKSVQEKLRDQEREQGMAVNPHSVSSECLRELQKQTVSTDTLF